MSVSIKSVVTVILILLFNGCASEEDAGGRAKGKVLYNGQPLTTGNITFHPEEVGGASYGTIDSQGVFELKTGVSMKGVKPGNYLVAIESWKYYPDQIDEKGNVITNGISNIPRKYVDPKSSGLKATVKPEGVNEFTFELTGEGEKESPKEETQK